MCSSSSMKQRHVSFQTDMRSNSLSLLRMRLESGVCVVFLLLLVSLVGYTAVPAAALQTLVKAGEVLVLEDVVPLGHMLTFQFQIPESSSPMPISLLVDDEVVQKWSNQRDGLVSITSPLEATGKKKKVVVVRVDNSASRFTNAEINFYFRPSLDFSNVGSEDLLDPLEKKVRALGASMQRLQALQVSLRVEQKNHRSTVEDANDRVLLWSVFQVLVLLVMSAFNFFFLKRFLEKKTFL